MSRISTQKPRYIFLDVVRILAIILVFIHHLRFQFVETKLFTESQVGPVGLWGLSYGDIGVSLFIMLSGLSLAISTSKKAAEPLKTFYYKRLLRIYPAFWIAYIFFFVWFLLAGYFPQPILWDRVLISLTGLDTYIVPFQFFRNYTLVGDWFIGFIILLYLIFPALFYAYKKNKYIFLIGIGSITTLSALFISSPLVMRAITTRFMEFGLGIFFAQYIVKSNWRHYTLVLASALFACIIVQLAFPYSILQTIIRLTLLDIVIGSVLYLLFWNIQKQETLKKIIVSLSALSYMFFLVHHQVILRSYHNLFVFKPQIFYALGVSPLLSQSLFVLLATFVLSAILHEIEKKIISALSDRMNKINYTKNPVQT